MALASPIANYVVSLSIDGRILSQGSLGDAIRLDESLLVEATKEQEAVEKTEGLADETKTAEEVAKAVDGKLVVAEDVAEGFVSWEACKLFFNGLAGSHPVIFWTVSMGSTLLVCVIFAVSTWWLGQWAAQYEHHTPSSVNNS